MISYLAKVSLSLYVFGPDPVDSRRLISSSMCLILMRTNKKYILPIMTSFRWYLSWRCHVSKFWIIGYSRDKRLELSQRNPVPTTEGLMPGISLNFKLDIARFHEQAAYLLLLYSNSICKQSSIPTSICNLNTLSLSLSQRKAIKTC